jgi:hypothetical protein
MTVTYTPIPPTEVDRNAYRRGYTVLFDGEAVGTTYLCISGGWTGAEVEEPSNDSTTVYTVRSLWRTRLGAALSLIQQQEPV